MECRPGKPRVITLPESHNSIRIEWDKPQYGRESIESYIVFYHEIGGHSTPKKRSSLLTDGLEEHITVNDLAVNKKYVFKILPFSSRGASSREFSFLESEESDHIQIKSQPSKPEAKLVTSNSIQLQWEMLGSRQDVEFYTVSFHLESDPPDKNKWRKQSTKIAETNFTVNELSPATSYIFRITAIDKAGNTSDGEDSNPIRTTNTSKPGKPTASKATDATIHLTWTHPEVGQDTIKSYTVLYCQDTGNSELPRKWKIPFN